MTLLIDGKHPHLKEQRYLGDGLYCGFDGFQIWLYASNGLRVSDEVALEPNVLEALFNYVERLHKVKITVEKVKPEEAEA